MYRRNLDILVAGGLALLGGAAYVAHVPGPVQVVLGIVLFFAPGYLWSQAILSQRLPAIERIITSAAMTLILPIIGGFVFYFGLRIPMFRSAWVGLLVVLTLIGVVALAIQRLREPPPDPRLAPGRAAAGRLKVPAVHYLAFGAAAVIGLGSVAFSVHNAEAQKQPLYSRLWMTPLPVGANTGTSTQASVGVTNYQGVAEQYEVKLLKSGKVIKTWPVITLSAGASWSVKVAYTATAYPLRADLYMLPNVSTPYRYVDNGIFPPKLSPSTAPTPSSSSTAK